MGMYFMEPSAKKYDELVLSPKNADEITYPVYDYETYEGVELVEKMVTFAEHLQRVFGLPFDVGTVWKRTKMGNITNEKEWSRTEGRLCTIIKNKKGSIFFDNMDGSYAINYIKANFRRVHV